MRRPAHSPSYIPRTARSAPAEKPIASAGGVGRVAMVTCTFTKRPYAPPMHRCRVTGARPKDPSRIAQRSPGSAIVTRSRSARRRPVRPCGTSVTSRAGTTQAKVDAVARHNPHVLLARCEERGYGLAEITPRRWTTTLHAIDDPTAFVELEDSYRRIREAAGTADRLVQAFTDERSHSYLSDPEYPALFDAMVDWIERGEKPSPDSLARRCAAQAPRFTGESASGCHLKPAWHPQPVESRVPARAS